MTAWGQVESLLPAYLIEKAEGQVIA